MEIRKSEKTGEILFDTIKKITALDRNRMKKKRKWTEFAAKNSKRTGKTGRTGNQAWGNEWKL